jgi:hypothetical protein
MEMIRITATLEQLDQARDDGIDVTVTGADQGTMDQVTFVLDRFVYAVQCGGLLTGTGSVTFEIQYGQVIDRQPPP